VCKAKLVTRPATLASDMGSCNTRLSNTGRKIAIDPSNNAIYIAMRCSTEIHVVKTTDGGVTFGPRIVTTIADQVENDKSSDFSIAVGAPDTIYLAATTSSAKTLLFTRSTDGGTTWAPAVLLATQVSNHWGAHVSVYGTKVYVSTRTEGLGGPTMLYANAMLGAGSFTPTSIPMNGNSYGDVIVDPATGHLWAVSDDAYLRLRRSTDGGATFEAPTDLPVMVSDSSWALGNGRIVAAGGIAMRIMPTTAPATFTTVTGQAVETNRWSRSAAVDSAGNIYAIAATSAGEVGIDRVLAGATEIADTRWIIPADGRYPVLTTGGVGVVAAAFTLGTSVYLTVQKY